MKAIILASLFAFAATSASAATLVNGSFEAGGDIAPGSFRTVASGNNTTIAGWTVGGAGVDYIGTYWQAADGNRSIDLSGANAGSISQSFATVIGQAYKVAFSLSGNPDGGLGTKIATAAATGFAPASFTYTVGSANSRVNMLWDRVFYTFRAAATTTNLSFTSGTSTAYGPAIDDVSITAVPEPAMWLTMIAGMGMVGVVARRRRRNVVVA